MTSIHVTRPCPGLRPVSYQSEPVCPRGREPNEAQTYEEMCRECYGREERAAELRGDVRRDES